MVLFVVLFFFSSLKGVWDLLAPRKRRARFPGFLQRPIHKSNTIEVYPKLAFDTLLSRPRDPESAAGFINQSRSCAREEGPIKCPRPPSPHLSVEG